MPIDFPKGENQYLFKMIEYIIIRDIDLFSEGILT